MSATQQSARSGLSDLKVGTTLGAYRLLSKLGSGGMGTVYLAEVERPARGLEIGQRVAVKIVHTQLLSQPGLFKRFLREAEIGKLVQHPNVVRTFDADAIEIDNKTAHHLVIEYVEGQTLRSLLDEMSRVPEELCRHVGCEVANALVAIHELGIVHRDLKPENVLITEDNVVKVMDLGIARLVKEDFRLSLTGAFVGSVLYGAPEQFDCAETDGRADLYSLGLCLFELITGRHPYAAADGIVAFGCLNQGEAPVASDLNPEVTPFFDELLKTLLARSPDDRFESAQELAEILNECEQSAWWMERAQAIHASKARSRPRIHVPRETALHGRGAQLASLHALYQKIRSREGQVLIIEGEAGIGKTRLIDEFVDRLRCLGDDVNLLYGNFPPGGAATATSAFCKAYRNHFWGEKDGLDRDTQSCHVVAPSVVPAFAALLRGQSSTKEDIPFTKDTLQEAFVHTARALSREFPTVIFVDDLHFTSDEGLALFAALALSVQEHRILLVGTTRPGIREDWLASLERLHHTSRLRLPRLGPKDLSLLVIDSLGRESLARDLAYAIGKNSDGNPLFALEIIRGLREDGVIVEESDGNWKRTRATGQLTIPASVTDLIRDRISKLNQEEKDILEVSSCCGLEFDPGIVADSIGMSRVPALKQLGRIEKQHRLVRSVGLGFVFDHQQVRSVLYTGLPGMLRQEYHAAIGKALEEREQAGDRDPKNMDGSIAVDICRHFLEGGRGERAVRYLDAALEYHEKNSQNDAALHLASCALSIPRLLKGKERVQVILRKVYRLDLLGRHEDEKSALDEALAVAEKVGEATLLCRIRQALGAYYTRISDYERARENLTQALEIATVSGNKRVEATSTDGLGEVLVRLGRYEEARQHHERALTLHHRIDDRRGEARVTNNLEFVAGKLGHYEDAWTHHKHALRLAEEIGYPRGVVRARNCLGYAFTRLGQIDGARRHHEAALSLARTIGFRRGEGHAMHGLAIVEEAAGAREKATIHYEGALALRREIADRHGVASTLVALGRHLAAGGREESATNHLDEAFQLAREVHSSTPMLLSAAHRMLLPGGNVNTLLELLNEHDPLLSRGGRMIVRFLLWKATKDRAHLTQAHRLLSYLRDHAPSEYRETMILNFPSHRDIMAAWIEHGESAHGQAEELPAASLLDSQEKK